MTMLSIRISFSALTLLLVTVYATTVTAQTKEITVDIVAVQVTAETEAKINALVEEKRFAELGTEKVTVDKFLKNESTQKFDSNATPKTKFEAITRGAKITRIELEQITLLARTDSNSTVGKPLQTTAFENRVATKFDGEHKTYCVSYKPSKGKFGSAVNLPVHQVIEDGTIANNSADVTKDGIILKSNISINEVTELSRFTYSDKSRPLTIELPECKTHQIEFSTVLPAGGLMIVKSEHTVRAPNQFVGHPTKLSKAPYVNRLFKNVGIKRGEEVKTFFIVHASER